VPVDQVYQDIVCNLEYMFSIVSNLVFVRSKGQIIDHENVEPCEMLDLDTIICYHRLDSFDV
jgi:hypothetical protein